MGIAAPPAPTPLALSPWPMVVLVGIRLIWRLINVSVLILRISSFQATLTVPRWPTVARSGTGGLSRRTRLRTRTTCTWAALATSARPAATISGSDSRRAALLARSWGGGWGLNRKGLVIFWQLWYNKGRGSQPEKCPYGRLLERDRADFILFLVYALYLNDFILNNVNIDFGICFVCHWTVNGTSD